MPDTPPLRRPTVFRSLAIENFRGFQRRQEFDLDASVVILRGPNGVGKTSIFDALQWLLVGEIPRLRDARLRKTDEHIVNAYADSDIATVEATLETADGPVDVTRTGNRVSNSLVWHAGNEAPLVGRAAERALGAAFGATEEVSLETALTSAGLLQQDAARLVLQNSPKGRFTLFAQLLGLSSLEQFETWAEQRAKDAGAELRQLQSRDAELRERIRSAEQRLDSLRLVAEERPSLIDASRRLAEALAAQAVRPPADLDRDRAARISAAATAMARDCHDLSRLAAGLPEAPVNPVPEARLAEVAERNRETTAMVAVQQQGVANAEAALRELQDAQAQLQQLASVAIPLVGHESCPLCRQPIADEELLRRISELGGSDSRSIQLAASLEEMRGSLRVLEADRDRLERLGEELQRRWALEQANLQTRSTFEQRVGALQASAREGLRVRVNLEAPELAQGLNRLSLQMQELSGLARELVFAFDAVKSSEEASLEAQLAKLRDQLGERSRRLEAQAARYAAAKQVAEAATASRLDVVREQLERLRPVAQDVYSRMDPHPTFTELQLVSELFRSSGTTTAQVLDARAYVSVDPMLVFSAAQGNVTALAYLIALNWAAGGRIPMLLLDDPLQAMDDINVLGFADLCRHLRGSRQLILSTHERRFADLLQRKLAPRQSEARTIVLEFMGWDRSGPEVKQREVVDQFDTGLRRAIPK